MRACLKTLILIGFATAARAGEPDLEYGEYLAAECTTCHMKDAEEGKIPAIHGQSEMSLAEALYAYRSGERAHRLMQTITARLTDEDIAALAAWFAAQPVNQTAGTAGD